MARWNILNVPDDLASEVRIRAAKEHITSRALILNAVTNQLRDTGSPIRCPRCRTEKWNEPRKEEVL